MTSKCKELAEAFSSHRFSDAYPHLADDVHWVLVGETTLVGREAVMTACQASLAELENTSTEFTRFISVVDTDRVAIDAIGRYVDADHQVSVVSSCDIYEFEADRILKITSYAVELPSD